MTKNNSTVTSGQHGDRYDGYLFTFKAEEWDEFVDFLGKWSACHSTTEEWSSGNSKSIPKGVPIFLMKQGKAPTGIIAAGFTTSENHPSKRWSKRKKRMVLGRANTLRFTRFLNPEEDQLLDINDLPKQYWASRASGIGLPPELFRDIKKRWNALPAKNAKERFKARSVPPLKGDDAADDYKISSEDTRAIASRQIRERRGQRSFRQKMIEIYSGRCAVSGCRVADVLEAAHIKRYLGPNDNNVQNGLLLRTDLHTLFDLFLIGVHPVTKVVRLHSRLRGSEYAKFDGKQLRRAEIEPNFDALRLHWREFKKNGG